jgi:hypothetical protein
MRSFNFPVELWRSRFNINMPHPFVLDMPMKLGLKLVASVCSDCMDAEGEFLNHIINKLNSILLIMARVDLHRPDPGGIINSGILKTSDPVSLEVPQRDKFNVHLDVMARHCFGLTASVNCPPF